LGSITGDLDIHLKVVLELPGQSESIANGVPPASSIQGDPVNITGIFIESQ
jgi:hypothetical protein